MSLSTIIDRLKKEDPARIVAHGFHNPHSYRGDYEQLAFEPTENVTVGSMLACAESALGATYSGYKGGEYTMHGFTDCWLAEYGCTSEDMLGPRLLDAMLASTSEAERKVEP